MAIIVDKVQKRKDIALACKDLFVQNGIRDISISQIAKTAGVGKGSIYDYFTNKEDIVFELINILLQEHDVLKDEILTSLKTTKEKIKYFFNFFYNDEDIALRQLYKEFIAIALSSPNQEMIAFQSQCFQNYLGWFEQIIQEGIDKKEIIPSSFHLAKGLMMSSEGMFIASSATNLINDIKKEIDEFIDAIFQLIEVKNAH